MEGDDEVEGEKSWSFEVLGTKFVMGSFLDMLMTLGLGLLSYIILYGIYRAFLYMIGKKYDRQSVVHLVLLLPLALIVGNMTRFLFS